MKRLLAAIGLTLLGAIAVPDDTPCSTTTLSATTCSATVGAICGCGTGDTTVSTATPPEPTSDSILLESGDYILLEDGSSVLLKE